MSSNILREARRHEEIAEQLIPPQAPPMLQQSYPVGLNKDTKGIYK